METRVNKKLRIGLLMDSFDVPHWAYAMLGKIGALSCCEIKLVVLNARVKKKKALLPRIAANRDRLLYAAYWAIENRLHKPRPDAFEIKDSRVLLKGVPVINAVSIQTRHSDRIEDDDVSKITACNIDVLIRLGFNILRGKILTAARYGIWSYHHGDNCKYRGGPAGFWEVFKNDPVTGSILQILTEDLDNGKVICRGYSRTNPISVNYNRSNCYWKTLSFIPRKLEELHRIGDKAFFDKIAEENKDIEFYCRRPYTVPPNLEMLKLLIKYSFRLLKNTFLHIFYFQQWRLMFDLRENLSASFWRFKEIVPPGKNIFWADPHLIHEDNKYYIFIEEFICRKAKGHISLIIMDKKGEHTRPVKVLGKGYHMSNPFIFEWGNGRYMIPETADNKTIELYKCVEFPFKWELEKVLIKGLRAYDPMLFYYQQKWWLFANVIENNGGPSDDELFLFSSDNPLSGSWLPHPQNPVISDVRRARSAGRIFEHNGKIYRPAQDCSVRYGYGIRINQIIKLNEREYQETEIDYIEPRWSANIKGVHSFAYEKGLTVIDVLAEKARIWPRKSPKKS